MAWTGARIAQLTRLWAEGVSAAAIAEALGEVSRSAVLGKLYRLQLLGTRKPASVPRRYDGAPVGPIPQQRRGAPARAGSGAAADPPRSPWKVSAFRPLPGVAARPWLTRGPGECAFPVGGEGAATLSCCAAVKARSAYCARHHAIVFRSAPPIAALAGTGDEPFAPQNRWAA